MRYLVQEFVAHKWWTVRSFDNEPDAQSFRDRLSHLKTRIKHIIL